MDPIEKLLSELAPARAPGHLDETMMRLFNRANRKAHFRRATISFGGMVIVLAIGLAAGYRLGVHAEPPAPVTYIIPMTTGAAEFYGDPISETAHASISDSSKQPSSMAITIVRKDTV